MYNFQFFVIPAPAFARAGSGGNPARFIVKSLDFLFMKVIELFLYGKR
jgi:hypothetical protein